MSDTVQSAEIRIRALEFDPRMRVLQSAGRKTMLDARSSRVLQALIESFGDCATKDQLMRAGWPDQLVHENSLAKSISKLRRAIEGSGIEIAAAYGVGYRMRESVSDAAGDPAVGQPPPAVHGSRLDPRTILMMVVGAVVLIAVAVSLVVNSLGLTVPIRRSPPITNDPADATTTILWVDDHPSNNALEVQELRQHRVAVHLTKSTDDALKLLGINRYKLVVSDLGRGEDRLAGLRMIATMKQRGMSLPVIIYTVRPKGASGEETLRRMVASSGASELAVTPEEVRSSIARHVASIK